MIIFDNNFNLFITNLNYMANLIYCNNGYICFEGLMEFLLSLFYLCYLFMSYRIISHDKSGVLV